MTCSAISLSSTSISASSSRSSASLAPRGRVPAIGRVLTTPSCTRKQHLGRRADDLVVAGVEQVHVGRGIERAQDAVEGEWIDASSRGGTAGSARPGTRRPRRCTPSPAHDVLVVVLGEVREFRGDRANVDGRALSGAPWRRVVRRTGRVGGAGPSRSATKSLRRSTRPVIDASGDCCHQRPRARRRSWSGAGGRRSARRRETRSRRRARWLRWRDRGVVPVGARSRR